MERIFHPYNLWEDYEFGMYKTTAFMDQHQLAVECKNLLECKEWLWESMTFVSHNWHYAAEQNLTNLSRNRQAWLGQAACCFSHGAPEYVTKIAWNLLTAEKQAEANSVADEVIADWEDKHRSGYFARLRT